MPKRMIREGLIESEAVNSLTWQGEVFFVRLMLKADDFGRYSADTRLARAALYPLRLEQVREADVSRWIAECVKAGLVRLYTADGKAYLEIPKFDQRMRAKKSRYPAPKEDDGHMTVMCPTSDGHVTARREVEEKGREGGTFVGHASDARSSDSPEESQKPRNGKSPPIALFEELWTKRYGKTPILSKADCVSVNVAFQALDEDERLIVVRNFLEDESPKVVEAAHPIRWMVQDLSRLRLTKRPGKPAQQALAFPRPQAISDEENAKRLALALKQMGATTVPPKGVS